MPQQLIYTSSPRGVTPGRSGYCTVARSATMRDALTSRLEQLSYYQHLSLSGGQERPVATYRIVDIRGTRYHVLSRLLDAGLDYTNRTNFLAHHLVLTAEEAARLPSPPVLFLHWDGWRSNWEGNPLILDAEDWGNLNAIDSATAVPARTWSRLTEQGENGFGLLDLEGSAWLQVDGLGEGDVLLLFAESLNLLAFRERQIPPALATWQVTFTTAYQEQDSPNDFRWRCFQSGAAPVRANTGQSVTPLLQVRPKHHNEYEQWFAEHGPAPAAFVQRPQDREAREGEAVTFQAEARGVPSPTYEWLLDNAPLPGQTGPACVLPNVEAAKGQPRQFRVTVRVTNGYGKDEATAKLVVKPKPWASPGGGMPPSQVARRAVTPGSPSPAGVASPNTSPANDTVLMLIAEILDSCRCGKRQAAEPLLQELRRRPSELTAIPKPILEKFLADSKEVAHEELIRMLGSERARRPKTMARVVAGILVLLCVSASAWGGWKFREWRRSRTTPPTEFGTPATNSLSQAPGSPMKSNKTTNPKIDVLARTNEVLQPAAPPDNSTRSNSQKVPERLSKGTNYFMRVPVVAGRSPIPTMLKPLFDHLLPPNATSNLQFAVIDLNDWESLQAPRTWHAVTNGKTNQLQFAFTNGWKITFDRATNGLYYSSDSQNGGGKIVIVKNKIDGNETLFRMVLLDLNTNSLPQVKAEWENDHLKFDDATKKGLEILFGVRHPSNTVRLSLSFWPGSVFATNMYSTNLTGNPEFPAHDFLKKHKDRLASQKESWDALEQLVGEGARDGDAFQLQQEFGRLKTSLVKTDSPKKQLKECLSQLLKKLIPNLREESDWTTNTPSEELLKMVKPPATQEKLKRFFPDGRTHLIAFLDNSVADSQGKASFPSAQEGQQYLVKTLSKLYELEQNPVGSIQGVFEVSVNAGFHPVLRLNLLKSP